MVSVTAKVYWDLPGIQPPPGEEDVIWFPFGSVDVTVPGFSGQVVLTPLRSLTVQPLFAARPPGNVTRYPVSSRDLAWLPVLSRKPSR